MALWLPRGVLPVVHDVPVVVASPSLRARFLLDAPRRRRCRCLRWCGPPGWRSVPVWVVAKDLLPIIFARRGAGPLLQKALLILRHTVPGTLDLTSGARAFFLLSLVLSGFLS